MANLYRRLVGPQAATTSDTIVWTNSLGQSARVAVRFTNTAGAGGTVRVGVALDGSTIATSGRYLSDLVINANDVVEEGDLVVNAGEAIFTSASATTINVYLSALLV